MSDDDEMNPGKAALILSKLMVEGQEHRHVYLSDERLGALSFAYSWLQNVANQED